MTETMSFLIDLFHKIQDTIEEIPFTEYEVLESKPVEFLKDK